MEIFVLPCARHIGSTAKELEVAGLIMSRYNCFNARALNGTLREKAGISIVRCMETVTKFPLATNVGCPYWLRHIMWL